MALGKCVTGIWLIILPPSHGFVRKINEIKEDVDRKSRNCKENECTNRLEGGTQPEAISEVPSSASLGLNEMANVKNISDHASAKGTVGQSIPVLEPTSPSPHNHSLQTISSSTKKFNKNFYQALLLGFSMTTRGEIGFLIAAVARTAGILVPQEVYLVVVWGILLCTIIGPVGVRIIVGRIENPAVVGGRQEILGGLGESDFPQEANNTNR